VQQKLKSNSPDDASVKVKLEATKRKLHEGYQKVENGLYFVIRLYFYLQICS
jgi:hypothetical protein